MNTTTTPELNETKVSSTDRNTLYPVFLKLENIKTLIIGGGSVGLEKLSALLGNSPLAQIHLVATEISGEIYRLAEAHAHVSLSARPFGLEDLQGISWVILATDNSLLHREIHSLCKERNILLNVADTPDLCDMYLGSIVQKGHLKVAISTNGKSPTIAKRLKETLHDHLPANLDESLDNLQQIRNHLKGDFQYKVNELNKLTRVLVDGEAKADKKPSFWKWVAPVFFVVLGGLLTTAYHQWDAWFPADTAEFFDTTFMLLILVGFLAQMIDGALGMAYGVSANTFLITLGIHPAAASASVHTAEIFTSAASGISHWRMKNIDLSLFKRLVIPGILGAIAGASLLSYFVDYTYYLQIIIGCYTLFLGIKILRKALQTIKQQTDVKRVGPLAFIGAFMDSIGGGGWGPIVTTTLLSRGNSPRHTIGSVNLTEFFVTFASSLTFFAFIGIEFWKVIVALIIGGVIAAPFGAYLTKSIKPNVLMIIVGTVVALLSLRIIFTALF